LNSDIYIPYRWYDRQRVYRQPHWQQQAESTPLARKMEDGIRDPSSESIAARADGLDSVFPAFLVFFRVFCSNEGKGYAVSSRHQLDATSRWEAVIFVPWPQIVLEIVKE
jgi:hypothetical protein